MRSKCIPLDVGGYVTAMEKRITYRSVQAVIIASEEVIQYLRTPAADQQPDVGGNQEAPKLEAERAMSEARKRQRTEPAEEEITQKAKDGSIADAVEMEKKTAEFYKKQQEKEAAGKTGFEE